MGISIRGEYSPEQDLCLSLLSFSLLDTDLIGNHYQLDNVSILTHVALPKVRPLKTFPPRPARPMLAVNNS
jgi:hypothetical protein